MNGHRAHLQGGCRPSVAPSPKHHPTHHLLAAGVEFRQEGLHPLEAFPWFFGTLLQGGGQLIQKFSVERRWATEHAVASQETPLLRSDTELMAKALFVIP